MLSRRLAAAVKELSNRHRFAQLIVEGKLDLFRKSKLQIEASLVDLKFDAHSEKGGFSYLLSTSIIDFTPEKLADLKKKLELKTAELSQLETMTARMLWRQDLLNLRSKLQIR